MTTRTAEPIDPLMGANRPGASGLWRTRDEVGDVDAGGRLDPEAGPVGADPGPSVTV